VSLTDALARELIALDERGLRRELRTLETPQGAVITIDGQRAINFSANNYLGLANDPALRSAATRALVDEGVGAGAARLIVGNLPAHRKLEADLAAFHGAAAALLFSSGYQANLGILPALANAEDALFSDELNHASIIDGCRLARARVHVYPHADMPALDRLLCQHPARRRFIVTDSVFSMDGDHAPLAALRRLADQHGAYLVVDEAHATGVMGPHGRGLAAELGVRLDVHMATLSKAFGTFGAYATGPQVLIDHLLQRARSFVFTTGLPPSVVAAATEALHIVASAAGDELRGQLQRRITAFSAGLAARRLLARGAGHSPIFPILIGEERRALDATHALLAQGIFAQAIRPPTVPRGTARLRFALMATHTAEHIEQALAAIDQALESGLIPRTPR
jgi:8-amino-7-oxononanoate synthase